MAKLERGMQVGGEHLKVRSARILRSGDKHAWLEIVLDEGRNRHIRRLLEALDVSVLRLIRVAWCAAARRIAKGRWRMLSQRK